MLTYQACHPFCLVVLGVRRQREGWRRSEVGSTGLGTVPMKGSRSTITVQPASWALSEAENLTTRLK